MQLTVWHKGTDKPVRDGVYQRLYNKGEFNEQALYCKFEGGYWYCNTKNYKQASKETYTSIYQKELKWRGITKDEK